MSKLSRLINMASKALDKSSGSTGQQGSGDWRGRVQDAANALAGKGNSGSDARPSVTPPPAYRTPPATASSVSRATSADDRAAIARYDYLMSTSDPQSVEQIHREAFERLTPSQRSSIQSRMSSELPPHERPASSSPSDLARAAGRSEAARPGRMRGLLSRAGMGAVGGAGIGLLGAVAGGAVLSAVAAPILAQAADVGVDFGALAEGVNVGDFAGGAENIIAGAGEQVSGLGEQLGGMELPNIRDLFG